MSKLVIKVTTFAINGEAHIYIRREDRTNQKPRYYIRPLDCPSIARLARSLHLGTVRGNTYVVPFMSGPIGWVATPLFE